MTEIFRWKNCRADVATYRHGRMAHEFLNDVVEPSLEALNAKIDELSRSDDPAADFISADTEELLHATTMAFCLSVQSMWERQIRTYLHDCAKELRPDSPLAKKAMNERWDKIDKLFFQLRGIELSAFDQYAELDLLHLLGNACRHGDGPSAKELWARRPDLWPQRMRSPHPFEDTAPATREPPSIERIIIPLDLIRTFVEAIAAFWDETEYIYLESIERKHESVEAKLVKMRQERAKKTEEKRNDHPPKNSDA